ncbi:uncharacterized protein LOC128280430 [Gossypium arboreum]|uniref:uncharacterized protein LOC128280430 n=1 Tax=Gossypium arboreum TaxID=29729 RepID=UPI0022F18B99|nr:uncharacterized protein LOC128280430 [Gossypium arboreum]
MDFVSGLPLTPFKKESVWVIVDQLTKTADFILVRTDYSLQKLAKLYVFEIVRLHGVPVSIISDRDPRFTSQFWKKLREALGPELVSDIEDKVRLIRDRLKAMSDRQKSYAVLERKEIEYSLGVFVFLKQVGSVAYQLEWIHDVFCVSMLRHYSSDPMHVISVEEIEVRPDLTFEEEQV